MNASVKTWPLVLLLLLLLSSGVAALDALPLHNDEGLPLTRAVEVWHSHPFWEIRDGKIVNHWAIAVFYPQQAPVFAARLPTILISLIGLASAYTLVCARFGPTAALLTGGLWIASPCLFFYEQLGFTNAEAGALVIVALLASLQLARTNYPRDAVLTGLALASAALVWWWKRALLFPSATCCCAWAISSALRLAESGSAPAFNLARLWATLTGYSSALWALFMTAGLISMGIFGRLAVCCWPPRG